MKIAKFVIAEILILLVAAAIFGQEKPIEQPQIILQVSEDRDGIKHVDVKASVTLELVPVDPTAHYAPLRVKDLMLCHPYTDTTELGRRQLAVRCGSEKYFVLSVGFGKENK